NTMLNEVASKFFVRDKMYPKFANNQNYEDEIYYHIGKMIHMYIYTYGTTLDYHLPLIVLESIVGISLTNSMFEKYAEKQDPDTFKQIIAYKNKPEEFNLLETGFKSIEDKIKDLC